MSFKCPICGKMYKTRRWLVKHVEEKHPLDGPAEQEPVEKPVPPAKEEKKKKKRRWFHIFG